MSDGPKIDPGEIDPVAFARRVGETPDSELRAGMASPFRALVLDGIFEQMPERLDAGRARGVDAVVHWRIGGRPEGGHDVYELIVRDGECAVSREPAAEPRVTFTVGGVDFLKLVTGNASGPRMVLLGRLKVSGDLLFAARLQSLFRLPGDG